MINVYTYINQYACADCWLAHLGTLITVTMSYSNPVLSKFTFIVSAVWNFFWNKKSPKRCPQNCNQFSQTNAITLTSSKKGQKHNLNHFRKFSFHCTIKTAFKVVNSFIALQTVSCVHPCTSLTRMQVHILLIGDRTRRKLQQHFIAFTQKTLLKDRLFIVLARSICAAVVSNITSLSNNSTSCPIEAWCFIDGYIRK